MYVQKICLYTANPRTFTNPILTLLMQSRITNYYVDKITAVFGFQRLVYLSVNGLSEFVVKNYKFVGSFGIESGSQLNNTKSI